MLAAPRRVRFRRFGACAATGTLKPGITPPGFQLVGTSGCCDHDTRPKFHLSTFRRAGSLITCGGGCTPGQTIFETTIAAVNEISSDTTPGPPHYGALEVPVGVLSACNFDLTVEADCAWIGGTGAAIHTYLNDSGLDLQTRAFIFPAGGNAPQLANIPVHTSDFLYHHYTFVQFPAGAPADAPFSGPLAAQSVYLWCPVLFPDFRTGDWNVKNLHIKIVTV